VRAPTPEARWYSKARHLLTGETPDTDWRRFVSVDERRRAGDSCLLRIGADLCHELRVGGIDRRAGDEGRLLEVGERKRVARVAGRTRA
jgi:hypothetical protein